MASTSRRLWLVTSLLLFTFVVSGQQEAARAYTPLITRCPAGIQLVRRTETFHQALNADERKYVNTRESTVLPQEWATYLANVQTIADSTHTVLPAYVSDILGSHNPSRFPRLAITASGGGFRAAIFSAGILNDLDGRNASSVRAGTGGLLQSASYIGGLSGGGWLLSSLLQANFPTIQDLIFAPDASQDPGCSRNAFGGWITSIDLLQPSSDPQVVEEFLGLLLAEAAGKAKAGFPLTVTDIWARSLARHFTNGTTTANFFNPNLTHGSGITLSGLTKLPTFERHAVPFPYLVVDSVSKFENNSPSVNIPGNSVPLTNPVYEFTPFEMGSYDPILSAFTPTEFLGSRDGQCVTGFDQLAFVAGASSNIFNTFNVTAGNIDQSAIGPLIVAVNSTFPQPNIQLDAAVVPNPFYGVAPNTYIDSNQTMLTLVDGGSDGEVSPLQPMLVKARSIDVIFVSDAAADTIDNFTNGSSLITSSERASLFPQAYSFPRIPETPETFVSEGLVKRPTFFGCNTSLDAPMLIYVANGGAPLGQAPVTNVPTAQTVFTTEQIQTVLNQVNDIATQGIPQNNMKDPEWPVCLACGVVDRARERLAIPRSGVCAQCLARYCWS